MHTDTCMHAQKHICTHMNTCARQVGQWADVCRAMLNRRMQPLLLMYEDKAGQGGAPSAPSMPQPPAASKT